MFGTRPLWVLDADDDAGSGDADDAEKKKDDDSDAGGSGDESKDAAFAEMRRKLAAETKARKLLEARLAKDDEDKQKADGKFKELAESEKARADAAEAKLAEKEQRAAVEAVAKRLKFANPSIAHRLLDADDFEDETLVEAALKQLAKAEPYLLEQGERRTGREVGTTTKTTTPAEKDADPTTTLGQAILDRIDHMKAQAPQKTTALEE